MWLSVLSNGQSTVRVDNEVLKLQVDLFKEFSMHLFIYHAIIYLTKFCHILELIMSIKLSLILHKTFKLILLFRNLYDNKILKLHSDAFKGMTSLRTL